MLPLKLVKGQLFKDGVVNKINQIIDYLKTQRIISDNKTIKINQYSSGIGFQVIQNSSGKGSGSGGQQSYPFKLSTQVEYDQEDPTEVFSATLHVEQGRIQIFSKNFQRCYVSEYTSQYEGVDLTVLEDQGVYNIILMIQWDPEYESEQGQVNNAFIPTIVFVSDESSTSSYIPQLPRFIYNNPWKS